jgi:hypothetical protein
MAFMRSAKTEYLIRAVETNVPEEPPPLGELSGRFTWFEPDFAELVQTLRHVYENREGANERGRAAAKHVRIGIRVGADHIDLRGKDPRSRPGPFVRVAQPRNRLKPQR